MTEQQEKPNLEVLLPEFVAELKRPLDPQVLSLFSRCGGSNLSAISSTLNIVTVENNYRSLLISTVVISLLSSSIRRY